MESYADMVGYDLTREPRSVQECVDWWLEMVAPQRDKNKRAQARASWRRMFRPIIQETAASYIKLII